MNVQVGGMLRSGVTRAVAVLGVVAGVFAMHGLTGNHDAAMAADQMNVAPRAMVVPADSHRMEPANTTQTTPIDEHHSMGGACLAVLTGLALLLAFALAMRSLLAWRSVKLIATAEHPILTGRSPPWLTPSLSKLCVLRI